MKKSKKVLLWSIVPVLGVSSGVAGAVAGTKDQTTSVGTNNVATSSSATTMAARNTSSNLKITSQTREVIAYSDRSENATVTINVSGASNVEFVNYRWEINRGDGWKLITSTRRPSSFIDVPKNVNSVLDWTVRCKVTDLKTNSSITSENIKFTIVPSAGIYIKTLTQPISNKTVLGGQEVTLETKAEIVGQYYKDETIGYQWFEYDSENNNFTLIKGANQSTYTFTAPRYSKTQTKRYVCRYYFTRDNSKYLSESSESIITINKGEEEKITVKELKASNDSINVGGKTILSVKAESNITSNLTYQWYKIDDDGHTFNIIDGATSSTYEYTAVKEDYNKALLFCVLIGGSTQDGVKNHLQSDNLEVKVGLSSETAGSVDYDALSKELNVTTSVTTNQASVRSNFYLNKGITSPKYTISTNGSVKGLTYEWYYVGRDGKENLIKGADTNVLEPTTDLLRKVYNDNSNHKVDIVCKILKDGSLIKTVDKTTNSRFYLGVVINNRRVSNI